MSENEIPGIAVVPCRVGKPQGVVKCWILYDGPTTVLIDTGQDADDAAAINRTLEGLGRSLSQVDACVLTHRHFDHVGGLKPLLAEAPSMPVYAPASDHERIKALIGVSTLNLPMGPLQWLPDVEVIAMPGHTPGTTSLYWHSRRVLIAGDAIYSAGRHLIVPPAYLCDNYDLALKSVEALVARDLPIEMVLVAHGEDVYQDGMTRIRRIPETRRDNNG